MTSVPVADLAHARHEALVRRDHPARAQHRLHDEGGDGARALEGDLVLQRGEAQLRQPGRVGFVERVAIGVGGRDVVAARHQRLVHGPEIGVAVDRGAQRMRAVVALLQAQVLHPARLAAHLVILPRQPQRDLDAVRPARGEERPAQPVGGEELGQHVAQLDHRVVRGAPEDRVIGQPVELRRDRLLHRGAGIAEVDVPQAPHPVDGAVPVHVGDLDALAAHDDVGRVGQAVGGMRHRVPDLPGIVFLEEVRVLHGRSP